MASWLYKVTSEIVLKDFGKYSFLYAGFRDTRIMRFMFKTGISVYSYYEQNEFEQLQNDLHYIDNNHIKAYIFETQYDFIYLDLTKQGSILEDLFWQCSSLLFIKHDVQQKHLVMDLAELASNCVTISSYFENDKLIEISVLEK